LSQIGKNKPTRRQGEEKFIGLMENEIKKQRRKEDRKGNSKCALRSISGVNMYMIF
jgi:hypothetical protein